MTGASLLQRTDGALRGMAPVLVTLALVLVSLLPLKLSHFAPITPALALMAVYYWSVRRPDLLPFWATFAIGLVHDLLAGGPVGLTPVVLLGAQGLVVAQRRFLVERPFHVMWLGFAVVAPGAALMGWILASLYHGAIVGIVPALFQLLLTVALFPCVAWLLAAVQRVFLRQA